MIMRLAQAQEQHCSTCSMPFALSGERERAKVRRRRSLESRGLARGSAEQLLEAVVMRVAVPRLALAPRRLRLRRLRDLRAPRGVGRPALGGEIAGVAVRRLPGTRGIRCI